MVVSLVRPTLLNALFNSDFTRKQIAAVFSAATFGFLVLAGLTEPGESSSEITEQTPLVEEIQAEESQLFLEETPIAETELDDEGTVLGSQVIGVSPTPSPTVTPSPTIKPTLAPTPTPKPVTQVPTSTPKPYVPLPTATPAPVKSFLDTSASNTGWSCSCSKTCSQMSSCDEAYFQLNNCGWGARDGDNDGVPCETICN